MKGVPAWLSWIVATVTAAIAGVFTLMSYSHSNFTTVKESQIFEDTVNTRLNRIEDKIDRILERGK